MDLTTLSIIGRKHSAAKKSRNQNLQDLLQRKISLAFIFSNMSTVKGTIKQTVPAVLIGENVSTESSMVENNRSLIKDRV